MQTNISFEMINNYGKTYLFIFFMLLRTLEA